MREYRQAAQAAEERAARRGGGKCVMHPGATLATERLLEAEAQMRVSAGGTGGGNARRAEGGGKCCCRACAGRRDWAGGGTGA